MVRQNIKNEEYFARYFKTNNDLLQKGFDMLNSGLVVEKQKPVFKKGQFDIYLHLTIASYTANLEVDVTKKNLITTINYLEEGWNSDIVKFNYNGKLLNQYLVYDQILWLLSLGYLLDISTEHFNKMVEIVDRDEIKDYLYEFIIKAKLKERKTIVKESYEFGWDLFQKLRLATTQINKIEAEHLVNDFIKVDWYNEHKQSGLVNSHKSKYDIYFGYWSFETAAIVKIMGLNDSSFRNCAYYPKDLL